MRGGGYPQSLCRGVQLQTVLRVVVSLGLTHTHVVTVSHLSRGRGQGPLLLQQAGLRVEGGRLLHRHRLVAQRGVGQDLSYGHLNVLQPAGLQTGLPLAPHGRVELQTGLSRPRVLLHCVTLAVVLQVVAVNEGLPAASCEAGEGSLVTVNSDVFLKITLSGEDLLTVL